MKILVYGAGVLGCNLAHQLHRSKKDVTLLARNQWYETIQKNGLIIQNRITHFRTKDKMKVVNRLEDEYDVIFVVVQNSQTAEVMRDLKNSTCKNIIFIGNNMHARECVFPDKNVLFGFYSAAGKRDKKEVCSFDMKKITIGNCNGTNTSDAFVKQLFVGTKIHYTICNQMDDYLKSHAAFILPFAFASYHYGNSLGPLKKDSSYMQLMIDATIEMYDALMAEGDCILPKGDYEFAKQRTKYIKFAKTLSTVPTLANICVCEHAKAGKKEMYSMKTAFEKMFSATGISAENFEILCGSSK